MRALCLVFLAASVVFGQAPRSQSEKIKLSDFEPSVVKIVVVGQGPAGYNSVGTGFFVGDHLIASAAHVYLEAAKAVVDASSGQIGAYKVFRDGRRIFFPVEYRTADLAHDVVLINFNAEEVKKQNPTFEIKPSKIDDTKPELGDEVAFLGYFAGDELPILSRTTIAGYTGSVAGGPSVQEQLILDLPANPGQSGSPVFDFRTGGVVGILASFVPVTLVPGSLPTHSGLSRSVEVVHLKRLIESAEVR